MHAPETTPPTDPGQLASTPHAAPSAATSRSKRWLDRSAAIAGLGISSPLLGLVALAIRLEDGPGILFSQDRLGQHGATIRVSKFRSMRHNDIDPTTMGRVEGTNPLVTHTGRVIRRLKLDELPQLIGVARGDLSLVGPRPTLVEHLADYDDFQRRRLTVRPGLTGWAQVNGNTSLSWDERIRLDVWYVDNWSFWLDVKILARTVLAVLIGERRNPTALEEATRHEAVARRRG